MSDIKTKKDRLKAYHKSWSLKNLDRLTQKRAIYYQKNKAAIKKRAKDWKQRNPEKVKASSRATAKKWYRSNPEEAKRKRKQWRLRNPEKVTAMARRCYNSNKQRLTSEDIEKKAAYLKAYAKKNSARLKAYKKLYRQENKWHALLLCQKRRALEKQASGNLALITLFISSVKSKTSAVCYYCQKATLIKSVHFDHIVPLSKGGQHSVDNLCVSCAHCNLSKHSRTPQAWIKVGQQLLAL